MSVNVVVGLQRGDEGKGRIVDLLSLGADIIARFNGGPNAGHTISYNGLELHLHQIPSGINNQSKLNIIGNGVLLDPLKLLAEMDDLKNHGLKISPKNLIISNTAHLILPHHIVLDEKREKSKDGQGTTKSGIAFAARDKYERIVTRAELIVADPKKLRELVYTSLISSNSPTKRVLSKNKLNKIADEWMIAAVKLKPFIADTVSVLHDKLASGSTILAEGAQAFGLDIEHGMYPYVTSSHTTTGGAVNGLGIPPQQIKKVIGVAKLIKSHVGGGPFVTKITNPTLAAQIRGKKGLIDSEYGATTGRERQIGYFDLPELRKAIAVNGVTEIALTKLDCVPKFGSSVKIAVAYKLKGKELKFAPSSALELEHCKSIYREFPTWQADISGIRKFDDLPSSAKRLVQFISKELAVPVKYLGVGPERKQIINLR